MKKVFNRGEKCKAQQSIKMLLQAATKLEIVNNLN